MTKNLLRKLLSVFHEFVILIEEEQINPTKKQTIIQFVKVKKVEQKDLEIKK